MRKPKLDEKDKRILKVLQNQGKITNIQLSKKVKLSPAPCLERVKKLEHHKFIKGYHAELDNYKLGLEFIAYINISLTSQKADVMKKFITQINKITEVAECYQMSGDYDYLLRVITKNTDAFTELVNAKLSKIDEIGRMQTQLVLKEHKRSHELPLDQVERLRGKRK